ncbi:RNase H domain-containing protein [Hirsutella rhossiliensis]|uniref:RNase H domain-containing protein n=1 Tax=Hirsutella rhossiliensis TaxID=111463 RepID=A0A9P8SJI6_9HYPO|nr:RNase H domain-containing protein [Hirsutella rhossiliensis]KAH0965343.1 RNase H domain-containing protein [Hirsutella rhossiliensis]
MNPTLITPNSHQQRVNSTRDNVATRVPGGPSRSFSTPSSKNFARDFCTASPHWARRVRNRVRRSLSFLKAFLKAPFVTRSSFLKALTFLKARHRVELRVELRAILGALRFRHWRGEGFMTLVFATDAEYVAEGASTWARGWVRNGWRTSTGAEVKNKDLWEMLLGEVERWDSSGLKIQFWRIPRTLNLMADHAAKQAAATEEGPDCQTTFRPSRGGVSTHMGTVLVYITGTFVP